MDEFSGVRADNLVGLESLEEAAEFVAHAVLPDCLISTADEFSVFSEESGIGIECFVGVSFGQWL